MSFTYSACRIALAGILMSAFTGPVNPAGSVTHSRAVLRVCSDPNNLPFSNRREQGFENEIAALIAGDMNRSVSYFWLPQRRGFIRNTLNATVCDVVIGVPANDGRTLTTIPYYVSTYVWVSRRDRHLGIASFDREKLRHLRIGIHTIGDDYSNVPPALPLANLGLAKNIVGYSIYGDYSQQTPPSRLIEAVARGDVDIAAAWGPLAGYLAKRSSVPLEITPIDPRGASSPAGLLTFAIAMGVRKNDVHLRDSLNAILVRRQDTIHRILQRYGVPLAVTEAFAK